MPKIPLLLSCLFLSASIQASDPDAVSGTWINAAGDGYIEITKNGDVYDGAIVGGPDQDDAVRLDDKNPDPTLRDRPLLGLKILRDFKATGTNKWTGGSIYDPNNGKTYKCRLELNDDGTLSVRGFIGISLFGRTEIWKRKKTED